MKHLVFVLMVLSCGTNSLPGKIHLPQPDPTPELQAEKLPEFEEKSTPCWHASNRPCFVVDVSAPERIIAQWRKMSFYGVKYFVVNPDDDPVGTIIEAHKSMERNQDPEPVEYGTVLYGPGSSQELIERVAGWLVEAGIGGIQVTAGGFPSAEELENARELDEIEFFWEPKNEADYRSVLERQELAMRACYLEANRDQGPLIGKFDIDDDGLVRNVSFVSALPAPVPTKPPCSEYDEDMGRCEREYLNYPDEWLEDSVLDCLESALRGARFSPNAAQTGVELRFQGPEPVHLEWPDLPGYPEN